jgi:hypothetical protein
MRHRTANQAFALIVTVIILALLAVMAVAFLSTSRVERGTARGVADKVKADLAAQSAANAAIARLIDNISTYPDSATTWESVNGVNPGTVLYFRDKTPEAAISAGTTAQLNVLPLISGGLVKAASPATSKTSSLPALDKNNSYDLNHARFSGDTQGWIGAPPGSSRPEYRGQWVDIADSSSPSKITARYAYWMEDESFKVNTNLMGNTLRLGNTLGNDPKQIPLQGMLATIGISASDYNNVAQDIFDFRTLFPTSLFFEYRALNQTKKNKAASFDFSTLADSAKFVATIYSGALNQSRSGSKRVNLNKIIADSTDAKTMRTQLDQIIKTITYHLPNFGQRFYRGPGGINSTTDVPPTNQTIYLNKIAANIRDYIDTDSQPTIVNNDTSYTIRIGTAPTHAIITAGGGTAGASEVIAIGKEHVPYVQEYVLRVRQVAFSPRLGPLANYTISIDHYVEFWNVSNRDITLIELGPNPFLLIADQPGWDAGGLTDIPDGAGRDIKLALNQATNSATAQPLVSFPAGSCTVITTDPQPLSTQGSSSPVQTGPLTPDLTRVYYIPIAPASLRTYSGQTQKKSGSELRLNLKPRTTVNTDYETEIALGNDLGILESAWGIAIPAQISVNVDLSSPPENHFDDTKYHIRGGHLNPTSLTVANATTGDPRTNAEQIRFDLNSASAKNDKTRYYDDNLDSKNIPGDSTLGAPNTKFTDPSKWPDYSSNAQSASTGPAVIANANLTSIGQLGDIFDPVRTIGDSNDITLSRSGGRTLKIGQPERFDATVNPTGLWDGDSNSASREWTAWRLSDIFTTSDLVQLDGRININGINRDGGAALKAAIYGYNFQPTPDSDPNLAGKAFDADPTNTSDRINELIKQMQARVTNDQAKYSAAFKNTFGPFAERGELSEAPMFNTLTDSESPVSGVKTAIAYDRGREELFRRMAELITTRGNIFTVYAAGQSLVPQSSGTPVVTSTSQLKVTFRIDPVWNSGTPTDPFDPTAATRFNKPDKYAIKILYAGE